MVITAEPGREFGFSRTEMFAGTVVWRYRFEPDGDGTRLTESYEVTRPITRLGWLIIRLFGGGRDRGDAIRDGMTQTVRRIRDTAERDARLESR